MVAPTLEVRYNVIELERVSTNKQDLERQEYDLADNRAEYGLNPIRKFKIKESGEKVLKHEDIAELVKELKRPGVDGVSLSAIDRFARPQDLVSIAFFQIFIDLQKVLVSKREGLIEPWKPRGRKLLLNSLIQAGNELSDLKDRLQSNRRKQHAQNKPMNTCAPYGIVYVDKYNRDAEGKSQYYREDTTPIDYAPEKTPVEGLTRRGVVEMIYRWRHKERLKTYRIVKRLNDLGILTGGRKYQDGSWRYEPGIWERKTVIQLMHNRHYIGEHWEGGKKVDVRCPQYIERDVFDAVQNSFAENTEVRNGRPSKQRLLYEFLECGKCRTPSVRHRMRVDTSRTPMYRCNNYDPKILRKRCHAKAVHCDLLDGIIFGVIWKHLTQPELLMANAKAYYDSLPSRGAGAKLEKELAEVEGRIERIQEMVVMGTMDKTKGNAKILEDMKRVREIEADLRAMGSVVNLPPQKLIEAACRMIAEGPEPSDFETRRPILEKLVDLNIVYNEGEYAITGKVPVAMAAKKCRQRIDAPDTSTTYIPLQIKVRVA